MENPAEAKKATRSLISGIIRALPKEDRAAKSKAACEHLLALPEFVRANAILLYAPLPDELDIWPALHGFADARKRIILPKCNPTEREVICIEVGDFKNDLIRGAFNILEPKSGVGIGLDGLDAVIAPARAFDRAGNRVGRGAGYYDRFFVRSGLQVFKCGIGFDCQLFPEVPVEPHDIPVDAIVTESGTIRVTSAG